MKWHVFPRNLFLFSSFFLHNIVCYLTLWKLENQMTFSEVFLKNGKIFQKIMYIKSESVSEWNEMFIHGLLFQLDSNSKRWDAQAVVNPTTKRSRPRRPPNWYNMKNQCKYPINIYMPSVSVWNSVIFYFKVNKGKVKGYCLQFEFFPCYFFFFAVDH